MIPWPIALLSALYGALTALSGAALWRRVTLGVTESLGWIGALFLVSACIMAGLALMRSWGRALAVTSSLVLLGYLLSLAALYILAGHPGAALAATVGAGVQAAIIRYLRRPVVKSWFVTSAGKAQ